MVRLMSKALQAEPAHGDKTKSLYSPSLNSTPQDICLDKMFRVEMVFKLIKSATLKSIGFH